MIQNQRKTQEKEEKIKKLLVKSKNAIKHERPVRFSYNLKYFHTQN